MKKATIGIILTSLISLQVQALNFMVAFLPPNKQMGILNYTGTFHKNASFPMGPSATNYNEMEISTPIYKTDIDAINFNLKGSQFTISPTQNGYDSFSELELNLSYSRALDKNRMWTVSTRYGSASDQIFADSGVTTFGVTGFYSFSNDEKNRWLMIVDYANDRPILNNLPLPGVAYVYNPNPSIRAIIGAPFSSLSWTFMENTAIDISTIVPWVLKGNLSYSFGPYTKVYTGLNLSQLTYFLHGRENLKERLFYDDRKIFIGAKFPVYIKTLADLEFGHAFDRSLFKAESYELNPNNPIRIENAFYTKISLVHIF